MERILFTSKFLELFFSVFTFVFFYSFAGLHKCIFAIKYDGKQPSEKKCEWKVFHQHGSISETLFDKPMIIIMVSSNEVQKTKKNKKFYEYFISNKTKHFYLTIFDER